MNNSLGLGIQFYKAVLGMVCCIASKQTHPSPGRHIGGGHCVCLDNPGYFQLIGGTQSSLEDSLSDILVVS